MPTKKRKSQKRWRNGTNRIRHINSIYKEKTLDEESIFGQAYIPITAYQNKTESKTKIWTITVVLSYDDNADEWVNRIKYFLMRKYNVKHIDLAWFSVSSLSAISDAIDKAMGIFTYLLAAIWSISLLVWWIWVMNIIII